MSQKTKWIFVFGLLSFIIVFVSSFSVNAIYTTVFRASISLIIGTFIGYFFYCIWTWIAIDFSAKTIEPGKHSNNNANEEID
ncbi:hypothetical protein [Evansella cellulosilytica]|uniref:Uncharacterized protein n=1 Tax=Evansella cellulosilytica (strain ATCC 21833 / DSM 2522 / FERM P-1141 / JCM 9156 / N-4) TaxID=649639 RepID=E6TSU0_EVAC2|nr:hypothetical protein [Evansella cellulosilytica]ADU30732.1 hypothetical protein Bcell_2475 [Evansella cellulosilytica DSM 2522]